MTCACSRHAVTSGLINGNTGGEHESPRAEVTRGTWRPAAVSGARIDIASEMMNCDFRLRRATISERCFVDVEKKLLLPVEPRDLSAGLKETKLLDVVERNVQVCCYGECTLSMMQLFWKSR